MGVDIALNKHFGTEPAYNIGALDRDKFRRPLIQCGIIQPAKRQIARHTERRRFEKRDWPVFYSRVNAVQSAAEGLGDFVIAARL